MEQGNGTKKKTAIIFAVIAVCVVAVTVLTVCILHGRKQEEPAEAAGDPAETTMEPAEEITEPTEATIEPVEEDDPEQENDSAMESYEETAEADAANENEDIEWDIFNDKTSEELFELAEGYVAQQDYVYAIAAYKTIIALEPENEDAYIRLAETYLDTGKADRYNQATAILQEGYEKTASEIINEKLERVIFSNDQALADTIRVSVLTALMDPEVVTASDAETKECLDSLYTGIDLCSLDGEDNMFLETVTWVWGIDDFSELSSMVKSSGFTGHIWVVSESENQVRVEIEGTDIVVH